MNMKRRNDNNLAEGEATGHAHRVEGTAEVFDLDESGTMRLTVPVGNAILTHEEHKSQLLEDDTVSFPQQEIDPDTEEARNVAD
jgi:hypothetical protein